MATATVSIVVPALPDSDVWFANNAAWANYWKGISGDVELDAADTTIYVPVAYNAALVPCAINVDGVDYLLVTTAMFASLMAQITALDTALQNMRSEMKDAGYITEAQ